MRDDSSVTGPSGTALFLGGVGVLAFSGTLPATRAAVPVFGSWTVGIGRAVVAGVLAAVALRLARARRPTRADHRPMAIVAAGGVLGFPAFTALALAHVPASRSAVVIGLLPAATAAYATVRGGERPSRAFWAAALLGLAAVVTFAATTGAGLAPEPADLLLLAAVASAAAAYGEGARLAHRLGGWQVIAWALVVALPVTVPVTAVAVAGHGPVDDVTGGAVVGFAYVAVISAFLGFLPWYAGLARGGVAHVSQVQLAQPLLTLVWSAALLGERVTAPTVVAAVAVLACVLAGRRAAVARPAPAPEPAPEPALAGAG